MCKFDDGGCISRSNDQLEGSDGKLYLVGERALTLWDYYAAHALTGNLAHSQLQRDIEEMRHDRKTSGFRCRVNAGLAAEQADAMIAEKRKREKRDE